MQEAFNFDRRETAVLCELLVRGPQTPGEPVRASRMHPFEDLGRVSPPCSTDGAQNRLSRKYLPRQPGTKEARYLICCWATLRDELIQQTAPAVRRRGSQRRPNARLEQEVAALQQELADVKGQLATHSASSLSSTVCATPRFAGKSNSRAG